MRFGLGALDSVLEATASSAASSANDSFQSEHVTSTVQTTYESASPASLLTFVSGLATLMSMDL